LHALLIDIEKQAVENGMVPLHEAALRKLRDGLVSIEEVIKETKIA